MSKGNSSIRAICIFTIAILLLSSVILISCDSSHTIKQYVDEEIRRLSMLMLDIDLADPVHDMDTLDPYFESDYSNKTAMLEELDASLAELDEIMGEISNVPEDIVTFLSEPEFTNLRAYVFLKANNMKLLIEFIKKEILEETSPSFEVIDDQVYILINEYDWYFRQERYRLEEAYGIEHSWMD